MQCPKKACNPRRLSWPGRRNIGRLSFDPGHNTPKPGVVTAGYAYIERGWHRNRKSIRKDRQPFLLVTDNLSCDSTAWQPHGKLRAEPKDSVIPAGIDA